LDWAGNTLNMDHIYITPLTSISRYDWLWKRSDLWRFWWLMDVWV